MDNQKNIPNKLINETSPYLLQHAHNPVDWYPWGQEAFDKAKKEDKPVFLSIGYSTCHWCHVMAHESFEDKEVAKALNDSFISVKVDREERPDIDEVYMSVCQAMTGSGGWPLTIIMRPDKKPFYAGTYLPRESAFGRTGLIELLERVAELWETDREGLVSNGEKITGYFSGKAQVERKTVDVEKIIRGAYSHIKNSYEEEYGGFSQSPKFPSPHYLLFLLKYWKAYGDDDALRMAEHTLGAMYRGGIFDHVGGGFSRYSTDRQWLVPHFEKMLYDNALLLLAYSEGYAATGNELYKTVTQNIAAYVMRDMQSLEGGFYSAEDADSEGKEGKYYVWDYAELEKLLTDDELCLLEARYGVSKRGNFEGKNILNLINAAGKGGALETSALGKLYEARRKRVPPFKDTKIMASWNGLMIEALARAGEVFGDKECLISAAKAADFVLGNMTGGKLHGSYKEGTLSKKAFLADYANMAGALAELYSATLDTKYLEKAMGLVKEMIDSFWDKGEKRFFMCAKGEEELFMRPRDEYDGAMPSGNSSAITVLAKLKDMTGLDWIREALGSAVEGFAPTAAGTPGAYVHFISSLLSESVPHRQVVIAAGKDDIEALEAYRTIRRSFLPFTTAIYYDKSEQMKALVPDLEQYDTEEPFAGYVCENFACKKPVADPDGLMRELGL